MNLNYKKLLYDKFRYEFSSFINKNKYLDNIQSNRVYLNIGDIVKVDGNKATIIKFDGENVLIINNDNMNDLAKK